MSNQRSYGGTRDHNAERQRRREGAALQRWATYRLVHPTRFSQRKGQMIADRDLKSANKRRNAN